MAILQRQSIVIPLFGVMAGHLWWFTENVFPVLTNIDVIGLLCFRRADKNERKEVLEQ